MHTMPPIDNAVTKYGSAVVQPNARKQRQVINKVATVMPEIGFDDEPISPVRRDETVTNRKPNTTISRAPRMFMCRLRAIRMQVISRIRPMPTTLGDKSRSVRGVAPWADVASL